jgi:hypothetical protein
MKINSATGVPTEHHVAKKARSPSGGFCRPKPLARKRAVKGEALTAGYHLGIAGVAGRIADPRYCCSLDTTPCRRGGRKESTVRGPAARQRRCSPRPKPESGNPFHYEDDHSGFGPRVAWECNGAVAQISGASTSATWWPKIDQFYQGLEIRRVPDNNRLTIDIVSTIFYHVIQTSSIRRASSIVIISVIGSTGDGRNPQRS